MPITTTDCKNAILKFFSDHPEYPAKAKKISDITRLRKYKNTAGLWVRTFSHIEYEDYGDEYNIWVIEQTDGSFSVGNKYFSRKRISTEILFFILDSIYDRTIKTRNFRNRI